MFSVVMSAYNASQHIGEAIGSVLAQTYSEFELLIINDGSTDDTSAIAHTYAARDERVRVINNERNCGIGAARNIGLQAAKYPWIVIQDADDIALPDRLEKVARWIATDPDVIGWAGLCQVFGDSGRDLTVIGFGPRTREEFAALRAKQEPIMFKDPGFAFRRDIALALGGYHPQLVTPDIDLMDRLSDCGVMLLVPEFVTRFRQHQSSTTVLKYHEAALSMRYVYHRRMHMKPNESAMTYDEFKRWYGQQPKPQRQRWERMDRSRMYWNSAGTAIVERQWLEAGRNLILSFMNDPAWMFNRALKFTGLRRQVGS